MLMWKGRDEASEASSRPDLRRKQPWEAAAAPELRRRLGNLKRRLRFLTKARSAIRAAAEEVAHDRRLVQLSAEIEMLERFLGFPNRHEAEIRAYLGWNRRATDRAAGSASGGAAAAKG